MKGINLIKELALGIIIPNKGANIMENLRSTVFNKGTKSPPTYELIEEKLATTNPLLDKPFKILLSWDKIFLEITEEILGRKVTQELVSYNGEFVSTVKGKEIKMDSLRKSAKEWIDVEGQQKTSDFPFERHLYYWAYIYSQGINESMDFLDLLPVTVIVIYKNKGKTPLMETARLTGPLFSRRKEADPLLLVAVNAAKWQDAKSEKLKSYLSLFHNGLKDTEEPELFDGLDLNSDNFTRIRSYFRKSCGLSLLEKYEQEGDEEMKNLTSQFLTAEERAEERKEGMLEGEIKVLYKRVGMTPREIATELELPIEEIKAIIKRL